MRLDAGRRLAIAATVRARMAESGVDNYQFADGTLSIGAARYAVDMCGCGEAACDGLRLRPLVPPAPPARA